jgi:hypothetical protein
MFQEELQFWISKEEAMKTKLEVLHTWLAQSDLIATGMDSKTKLKLRDECAKEFAWFSATNNETSLKNRIEKYQRMSVDANIKRFDPLWEYRLEFLKWILAK